MLLAGSISLGILGCSDEEPTTPATNENLERVSPVEPVIDLSKVFELRIEGKTDEAINLLRTLNEQHPTSVEVMIQLARSLLDAKQFSLAAFRFEQALSLNPMLNFQRKLPKRTIYPRILTPRLSDTDSISPLLLRTRALNCVLPDY